MNFYDYLEPAERVEYNRLENRIKKALAELAPAWKAKRKIWDRARQRMHRAKGRG